MGCFYIAKAYANLPALTEHFSLANIRIYAKQIRKYPGHRDKLR